MCESHGCKMCKSHGSKTFRSCDRNSSDRNRRIEIKHDSSEQMIYLNQENQEEFNIKFVKHENENIMRYFSIWFILLFIATIRPSEDMQWMFFKDIIQYATHYGRNTHPLIRDYFTVDNYSLFCCLIICIADWYLLLCIAILIRRSCCDSKWNNRGGGDLETICKWKYCFLYHIDLNNQNYSGNFSILTWLISKLIYDYRSIIISSKRTEHSKKEHSKKLQEENFKDKQLLEDQEKGDQEQEENVILLKEDHDQKTDQNTGTTKLIQKENIIDQVDEENIIGGLFE